MTVIQPNSITGINSITVQTGQALNIHDASGNLIRNITNSSGVSTFSSLHIGSGTTTASQGINIGTGASIGQNTVNELHFFTSGTNHFGINNEGQLTCQGAGSQLNLTKTGSDATEVTATLYTSNSGTHNQVTIKTSTNNGGDPYLKFDGGGQDMVVGERYAGTTNNLLVLGPGSNPDTELGIFVKGTGIVGINTDVLTSSLNVDALNGSYDVATFNSNHAQGVLIGIQRSGSNTGFLGSGKNVADATGGVDDIGLRSQANLIFTSGGGTERVRIDSSSGSVGIASTNPDRSLTVYKDAVARINIKSLNNSNTGIEFGDQNDQNAGYITYDNTDNSFAVGLNGTGEKVSIDSNGNVSLASSVTVTGVTTAGAFIPSKGQLSNRNIVINGAMQVAQRATSNTNSDQGYRTCDRFTVSWSGLDSVVEQHQVTLTSGTPYNLGFRNAWKLVNGDQTGGAGASDYIQAEYRIEARDIAQSGWDYTSSSSYITLSFWLKTSVSQDYTINFTSFDGTSQRYPMKTGTIAADTWTKITKTVPGGSNVQFDNDTGKGLAIMIYPYLGNSYVGGSSINTWSAANVSNFGGSSATSWYTTNDATFEITGFQLEVGQHATPFEHRSYAEDLRRCQRYYQEMPTSGDHVMWGYGRAESNTARVAVPLNVPLRASPTLTCDANRAVKYDGTMNQSTSTPSVFMWKDDFSTTTINFGGHSSLSHNNVYIVASDSGSTGLQMDAEI